MGDIVGRVALVTGGSGEGMGRSIALTLARESADVAITYRRHQEAAQRVATAIQQMGRQAMAVQADVRKAEDIQAAIATVGQQFGHIDILVNNAGALWRPQDFTDISLEHWRRVMAAETDAVFVAIRDVLPEMRQRRWGRIINIGGYLADNWLLEPPAAPLDYPLGKVARATG